MWQSKGHGGRAGCGTATGQNQVAVERNRVRSKAERAGRAEQLERWRKWSRAMGVEKDTAPRRGKHRAWWNGTGSRAGMEQGEAGRMGRGWSGKESRAGRTATAR